MIWRFWKGSEMPELLEVLTRTTDDGRTEIISPGIGIWSSQPEEHTLLAPKATIGNLRCQTRKFTLQLPPDIAGRVSETALRDRFAPVQHGELLFILEPLSDIQDKPTATP